MKVVGTAAALLSLFFQVQEPDQVHQESIAHARILFVGNSLTYTHNLPALVAAEAKRQRITVETEMLANANYALEDHWNDGQLQQLMARKRFDFVILQQGPSSQAEGRSMLLDYGARIKALGEKHGTKLAFFMVWPAKQNYHTFDGVIKNYTEAAQKNNALLCPVGQVWKDHFDRTRDYSYYGPDLFHPSLSGSKVAAAVICKSLFP